MHSPFGQVLKAIRDNEQRALSLGYEADRYKLLAFVLSAALAGLAGATKAHGAAVRLAHRRALAAMSGEVVLMALVGGLGTIFGPVVGAFIIITHAELPGRDRRVGAGDPGRHLRGDRAGLPQGVVGEVGMD